ncbi:MAG: hypothetical protein JSV47_09510 [Deltaproteobacteria bacterium]|nr:MAG: hypothetical protein JSV47_09510 [Deltaproteobacteria bacterium]
MEKQIADLTITYLPFTFLEEQDLKRLVLYFHNIRLLQVLPDFDPGLPNILRASSLVQSFCPISTSLLETVKRAHQTYHQLGSVHQDGGLVQLLRSYALQEDFEDSRTGLVAAIRKGSPSLAREEVELVNDAVFLLFAHQLDREHSELDSQIDRIRGLETKLHAEVGIGSEEERETLAMELPALAESDHPRTRYPLQRLRAWTRLYRSHQDPGPFLPLTTSVEVLEEISERLPSQLADLTDRLETVPMDQRNLSILPDPRTLSLEEIFELRETLSHDGILDNWWEAVGAAVNRVLEETLSHEQWIDLQHGLQKIADEFQQHWPTPKKPAHYLRLDIMRYPSVPPDLAFCLATGLQPHEPGPHIPEGVNGITLLLSPSAPPRDDIR